MKEIKEALDHFVDKILAYNPKKKTNNKSASKSKGRKKRRHE